MSSRTTRAQDAAILADWVLEFGNTPDPTNPLASPSDRAIGDLCTAIADGMSIAKYCENYALSWSVLAAWIRKSPERNARYQAALVDRNAMARERLLDGWWDVANTAPDKPATHADIAKARDALAKAEGMFKESVTLANPDGSAIFSGIERVVIDPKK